MGPDWSLVDSGVHQGTRVSVLELGGRHEMARGKGKESKTEEHNSLLLDIVNTPENSAVFALGPLRFCTVLKNQSVINNYDSITTSIRDTVPCST